MVTKTRSVSTGIKFGDGLLVETLSEKIAKDIYYTIVLSRGVLEAKKGKGLSGKRVDDFFKSLLG